MRELVIKKSSELDNKLLCNWVRDQLSWSAWLKSLDPNIVSVNYTFYETTITFNQDEHKTWFLLRWS